MQYTHNGETEFSHSIITQISLRSTLFPVRVKIRPNRVRRLSFAWASPFWLSIQHAQVSAINSFSVDSRVFDDIPAATLTTITNYPAEISFEEQNVSSASGFANRDVWYFSTNGGTPYLFQNNDYFTATFGVTLTGGTPGYDLEAGYLFSNPSGSFGGDLQSLLTGAGVVVQFGGPSYYPIPVEWLSRAPVAALQLRRNLYHGPENRREYSVNEPYAASSPGNTYFDLGRGRHRRRQPSGLRKPFLVTNTGTAVFSNISIVPELNLNIALNGNQSVLYWAAGNTNFVC